MLAQKFGADKVFDLSIRQSHYGTSARAQEELLRLANCPCRQCTAIWKMLAMPKPEVPCLALSRRPGVKLTQNEIVMNLWCCRCAERGADRYLTWGMRLSPLLLLYGVRQLRGQPRRVLKVVATDDKFLPNLECSGSAVTAKTKAVLVNSPNNPTGVVYTRDTIRQIGELLSRKEAQYGSSSSSSVMRHTAR